MRLGLHALVCALSALVLQSVWAQSPPRSDLNYRTYYNPPINEHLASLTPLKVEGKFTLWYLLGEPLINCTAAWRNSDQLTVKMADGSQLIAEPGEVELYNMMLVAQLWDPEKKNRYSGDRGGHIAAFCDAGIVAQSGRDGFNVAGSPNWGALLCELPHKFNSVETAIPDFDTAQNDHCVALGGQWMSADKAKKLARQGIKFEDVRIKSVEFNSAAVSRRYEKIRWKEQSFNYKQQKAQAIIQQLGQDSANVTRGLNLLNRMKIKKGNAPPSAELLKEYDQLIASLSQELVDQQQFTAQWRQQDEQLVSRQLQHIRQVDERLQQQDGKLRTYREALDKQRQQQLAEGQIDYYAIRSAKELGSQMWGYKIAGQSDWFIQPAYIEAASRFDDKGLAQVTLKDELLRQESRQYQHSSCGKIHTRTVTIKVHRKLAGQINLKGQFVSPASWQEYETGHPGPSLVMCSG